MIVTGPQRGGYILKYSGLEIPFQVSQLDRTQLTINVHPELRVEVLAPTNQPMEAILDRVNCRAKWIVKQWRYFEQYQPQQPERRFVSGETHIYLGRQYRLKIINAPDSSVKLIGRYFCVQHNAPNNSEEISVLLKDWYFRHALALFTTRAEHWISECRSLSQLRVPSLVVRPMKKRWGSCSKNGMITLNLDLVKAPLGCIDYVIVHELCHLKIHNHSPSFYRLLTRCMPDWKQKKARLEKFVA